MNIDHLSFRCTRWPRAKLEDGYLIAGGKGQPWESHTESGWWRDLADIKLWDPGGAEKALAFIRRRGIPGGYDLSTGPLPFPLDGSKPPSNAFIELASKLRTMSWSWDNKLDQNGLSRFGSWTGRRTPSGYQVGELGIDDFRGFIEPVMIGVGKVGPQGIISIECETLDQYLIASASIHVRTRQPLARCAHCDSWYAPVRTGRSRYCSSTCRSAARDLRLGTAAHNHSRKGD